MNELTSQLAKLSSAEEFLDYFAIPYEQSVLNVCRLHILKRFYQYLRQDGSLAGLGETELFTRYRQWLTQAYDDFVASTPAQEKVFKVFQDATGAKHVSLDALRASMPTAAR